jgi:thymidylate kinase
MESGPIPLALVVLVGPQASGKSALASGLASELRSQGERVAVVELDQIAAMALPTLPSWEVAHRIFETVTGIWARADLTCVIAEGSGEPDEVSGLLRQTPPDAVAITVATTAPFEVALARARADPTRGLSKERAFLSRIYEAWPDKMAAIDPHLVIDTSAHTLPESIERVLSAVDRARMA